MAISTSRLPLTMMSPCGPNKLTSLSQPAPPRPPLGLGDDLFNQRPVVADHGLPQLAGPPRRQGQLRRRLLDIARFCR
ncbi:hypothetical protein X735_33200 [Mesorhizobium sp. L2C085B000]|nr:hypothetical protein X735_33200 [Mesorhizobium sp. L2C085B000]